MSSRIVVFGATGYTGELTARALVARGARPVLAARSSERVRRLANELGGLEYAVADVERPASVRALVNGGDVLISTVGPFLRWGEPAVRAAVDAGAHYLDSTGEPPFIRDVFERWGPRAEANRVTLLTAMGYDYVPGNLAASLALREAEERAAAVVVGYFVEGSAGAGSISGGTRASAAGMLLEPSYAWRGGRLRTERGARHHRTFTLDGKAWSGVTVGGSEHFALPALHPALRDVRVYLGWFGSASAAVTVGSAVGGVVAAVPGVRPLARGLAGRLLKGSSGGPDAAARARVSTLAIAEARDVHGGVVSRVVMRGPNPYDLTGDLLAWGATKAAAGALRGVGALGPAEAFGLDALEAGAADLGLVREGSIRSPVA